MPRYDLFRLDEGSPLWIAAAETMADVHARMGQLVDCPECLVLDSLTGEKISVKPGQNGHRQVATSGVER
jgi:hypothetical protein